MKNKRIYKLCPKMIHHAMYSNYCKVCNYKISFLWVLSDYYDTQLNIEEVESEPGHYYCIKTNGGVVGYACIHVLKELTDENEEEEKLVFKITT